MNHGHSLRQSFNLHGDSVSFSKRPLGGGARLDKPPHYLHWYLLPSTSAISAHRHLDGGLRDVNQPCLCMDTIHHLLHRSPQQALLARQKKKGKQKKEHSVERSQASSSKHPLSSIQIRSTAFKRKKERLPLSLRDGFSRTRIERKKSNSASIYHYHTYAGQLRLSCSPLGCETSLCWIKSPMTINRAFDFDHASTRIQESRVYHQTNSNFII
jgi:hypothetical protein